MRILMINTVNYGSTGNLMLQIADLARARGHEVRVCFPRSRMNNKKSIQDTISIGNILERNIHIRLAYLSGLHGCFSVVSTLLFLRKVKQFKPDIIHLHNLHGDYINLPILFSFIKRESIKVVWTLHDCWAFTGQCPYFEIAECDRWKDGCHDCSQISIYPSSAVDRSRSMWLFKRKWFCGVPNMTLVTPSQWLADLVDKSFLQNYAVRVIHNGIDLNVFKPCKSSFREKHGLIEKFVLLGVASDWGRRKGLDVFIELSQKLDNRFQIVLIGTDDQIDKQLPKGIISIHRTYDQRELAEIYSSSDLFINPTREDNYPTVNLEAIASGTPVITFDTGGSPESIDKNTGIIVGCDDFEGLINQIIKIADSSPFERSRVAKAGKVFQNEVRFREYVHLYEN